MSCKQAPFSIDFIVIGAGVTGLATALRLRQSGHRVTVIDKGVGPSERKGGAHLPPNPTKLLMEWGFGKQLKRYGLPVRASRFLSADDGHEIGSLEWREDILQESGADYFVIQYRDLCQMLFDAGRNAGVRFEFQLAVTSVQSDPARPRIILSDGRTMTAHVIIGADGPRSIVRESINGPIEETLEGHSVYVAAIPRDHIKDDPELYQLTMYRPDSPDYLVWSGENRHIVAVTTDQGRMCSILAFLPEVDTEGHLGDDIASDGAPVAANKLKIQCEPSRVSTYQRKRIYHRKFAEDWVDEYGRVIVMSEAAYPIWPFCVQSCSLPIEDAAVLSTLFTYLKSEEHIPYLSYAFQELREPRAQSLFSKETKALGTIWVPPGPARDARDEGLRKMLLEGHKGWDESRLRWQWEEICEIFAYHGREAAEDWWVMWGVLRERSQQTVNGFH
ncbi:hypothetical protein JVT61DRAFT_202 [Boletus reticuloceps]|uniref:FAD-binding domain-containing protein n=1 Tax=Boletus reticuloceps TaxID=495285 RepID=A0A8I2YYA2_9AGAM|nr:hypothetical protein JVT61DRAFT_202 [Boletus reticuloceps]